MLLTRKHYQRLSISIVTILVIVTSVMILLDRNLVTNAQDDSNSLASLLNETDSDIVIKFVKPVIENEPIWRLPSSIPVEGEEIQILRSIAEIGDDYICINEVAGGARNVICIPFTNIVSITYDDMN